MEQRTGIRANYRASCAHQYFPWHSMRTKRDLRRLPHLARKLKTIARENTLHRHLSRAPIILSVAHLSFSADFSHFEYFPRSPAWPSRVFTRPADVIGTDVLRGDGIKQKFARSRSTAMPIVRLLANSLLPSRALIATKFHKTVLSRARAKCELIAARIRYFRVQAGNVGGLSSHESR